MSNSDVQEADTGLYIRFRVIFFWGGGAERQRSASSVAPVLRDLEGWRHAGASTQGLYPPRWLSGCGVALLGTRSRDQILTAHFSGGEMRKRACLVRWGHVKDPLVVKVNPSPILRRASLSYRGFDT